MAMITRVATTSALSAPTGPSVWLHPKEEAEQFENLAKGVRYKRPSRGSFTIRGAKGTRRGGNRQRD